MYIVRRIDDNLVLYFFDTEPIIKDHLIVPVKAFDVKEETHEILQVETLPAKIHGGLWSFDGVSWGIANKNIYDSLLKIDKEKLTQRINDIRYSKIYNESIPYLFPGDTEPDGVQMRNDIDRQNIQDIVTNAILRDPGNIMHFMPTSNNLKTMTAQQIKDMGQYLKGRGDNIVDHAWSLKRMIKNAETIDDIKDIDISNGWPA